MATREPGEKGGRPILTWLVAVGTLAGTSVLAFRRLPMRRAPTPSTVDGASGRGAPSRPPSAKARALGFEPHDMQAPIAALVFLALLSLAGVGAGLMFGLLAIFHSNRVASAPHLTAEQRSRIEPPGPHLQVYPQQDLYARQSYEEGLLNSYAWLDVGHARARIPISRAMTLTVGHSLDATPGPAPANRAEQARTSNETE